MGSLTGARTLLTMTLFKESMHVNYVEIAMLPSTVSFSASSRVVTVPLIV